ncbi:MAG TPA: Rieske (2Fe-2S) protein [Candidatus Dormibacteraeota bacterium]|nr:Rieske (2Fe-2S) protein [Candidatus Dormibacteraeota bacterium]
MTAGGDVPFEAVSPEAADRVDAAVDALLGGRPPEPGHRSPDEVEAVQGAALLAGAMETATLPDPRFVESLAGRLRMAMEGPGAAPDAAAAEAAPEAPAEVAPAPPEPLPLHRTGRRAFLVRAGAAVAAAAAAGVLGDRAVDHLTEGSSAPPYGASGGSLVPDGASWHDVAALAAVRSAGPVRFRAGAIEGVLVATPAGGVAAYSAVCTHQGCVLAVGDARDRLVCPCHAASFALDGTPDEANYIPLPPLPSLRSRVSGERVEVLA